jgi:uncharacterized OsmC-like protein
MTTMTESVRNGIDTSVLFATLDAIKQQPELGRFQFRARNVWLGGAHNRSSFKEFYGAGQEDTSRVQALTIDAGEPAVLLGTDTGPNPAEALLHALAACLTTALVYVASARKVKLTRVTFKIEGDAPPEKLRELVQRAQQRSAVFDMVTHGVPVAVDALVDGAA